MTIHRMTLFNYLAQSGKQCGLTAAMAISIGWNCFASTDSLEQPINALIFNRMLANNLKQPVIRCVIPYITKRLCLTYVYIHINVHNWQAASSTCLFFCYICTSILLSLSVFIFTNSSFVSPFTSSWPHMRCDVGLEEGKY